MTRREKALEFLKSGEMSCMGIANRIYWMEQDKHYLNHDKQSILNSLTSSLSGTLNQMVKRGEIELSSNKGPKGGKMYKLK